MKLEELYDTKDYEKNIENKNNYADYEDNSIHVNRCPNCNRKMVRYVEWMEYQGQLSPYEYWECPSGCVEDENY